MTRIMKCGICQKPKGFGFLTRLDRREADEGTLPLVCRGCAAAGHPVPQSTVFPAKPAYNG